MADSKYTTLADLSDLIDSDFVINKKSNCIKLLRQITGKGLRETIDYYEQVWQPYVSGERPKRTPSTQVHIGGLGYVNTDPEPTEDILAPPMFLVGQAYKQLDGCTVLILGVSNPNSSYETVYSMSSDGTVIHRYNRRDFGRCTGSDHQNPDPRNLEVLT